MTDGAEGTTDRHAITVALIKAGGLVASAMCVSLTAIIIVMYVYS